MHSCIQQLWLPAQDQTVEGSSMDGKGIHKFSSLDEHLLVAEDCERETVSCLQLSGAWKAAHALLEVIFIRSI